jgi:chemotaxis protein histidine kinase CheA
MINIFIHDTPDAVVFTFEDDGRGIDWAGVEQRAKERGLLGPDVKPTMRELAALIFTGHITTAAETSLVSGRGAGLAAVHKAVKDRNGKISVKSLEGEGTTFTIRISKRKREEAVA